MINDVVTIEKNTYSNNITYTQETIIKSSSKTDVSKNTLKDIFIGNTNSNSNNLKNPFLSFVKKEYKEEVLFELTFYTGLSEENGGYENKNAMGNSLEYGQVASNIFAFGTKIELSDMGEFIVSDRGGNEFNSKNRLDVFIPRLENESDQDYFKRVNAMGRVHVKGFV